MNLKIEKYTSQDLSKSTEVLFLKENEIEKLRGNLKEIIEADSFRGKAGECEAVIFLEEGELKRYFLVGLGKEEKFTLETYKKALAKAVKEGLKKKISSMNIEIKDLGLFADDHTASRVIAETLALAGYRFDKYKTEEKKDDLVLEVYLKKANKEGLAEGLLLAESTIMARNLINEPSNIMCPRILAREAETAGKSAGFEVQVFEKEEIEEMGMHAFLAVGGGSERKPRLIVMRYFNDPENPEKIHGIVGKGLIYDSGGLSIKPTSSMLEMKSDMSGGSAVIGAFNAIARAGLKINAIGVIAACENMISGNSYRPGDIVQTMDGKTVFVGNTDAEGRLTLVDAITYALEKENVIDILDIATLTGAAVVALGDTTTAVLSNNEEFFSEIEEASRIADERIWRLPIFEDYREKLKAKEADLTNSAGNPGTITAAMFIEAFVQGKPWVHMDIAGTSWAEKEYDYFSFGGTGTGVRTIYHWLKNKSK